MSNPEKSPANADSISVFVHVPGQEMRVVAASPDDSLRKALHDVGVEVGEGQVVLVGEPLTTLEEGIDEEVHDEHAPCDLDEKVSHHAGGGKHVHVHCHTCRTILVTVRYTQHQKQRKFSPARTIARVRAWAIRKYHLQGDTASDKLVLEVCDSDKRPRPEQRLGELVTEKNCAICLDFVQSVAPQG